MFKYIYQLFIFALIIQCYGLTAQNDWKLDIEKPDIKVWTCLYKDTGLKQFKAEYVYDAKPEAIVAALMDVEKSNLWYDMVDQVKVLTKYSESEAIYRIDFDFPIVTSDRYSTVRGVVKKDAQTGAYIIRTQYEPYNIPNDDSKVKVTDIHSEWIITPIGKSKCKVTHSAFMNPAGNLAKWMVNSSIADGPVKSLRALKKFLLNYSNASIKI